MADTVEPKWKQFQDLVARLELVLGGQGVVVRSPDWVTDLQTAQPREVDATIRKKVGSVDVLITVECRRHADSQDVTWIEQLATKKRKIGASVTVAVSKAGFTSPALTTAAQEGIVPRTLEELAHEDLTWLKLAFHDMIVKTSRITQVDIELYDAEQHNDAELTPDQDLLEKCRAEGKKYPLFIKEKDGSRYDAKYVMDMATDVKNFDPWKDCEDGVETTGTLRWENYDRGILIETSKGPLAVQAILLSFVVKMERTSLPIDQAFRYSSPQGGISEGIQFDFPGTGNAKLVMMKEHTSGQLRCSIVVKPKNK